MIKFETCSSSAESSSENEEDERHDSQILHSKDASEKTSFENLFPTMKEVYGVQLEYPKRNNIILYKRLTQKCYQLMIFLLSYRQHWFSQ